MAATCATISKASAYSDRGMKMQSAETITTARMKWRVVFAAVAFLVGVWGVFFMDPDPRIRPWVWNFSRWTYAVLALLNLWDSVYFLRRRLQRDQAASRAS